MKIKSMVTIVVLLLTVMLAIGPGQASAVKKGRAYPYSTSYSINGALYDGSTESRVYRFKASRKAGPVELIVTTSSGFVAETSQTVTFKAIYRPKTKDNWVGPDPTWAQIAGKKASAKGIAIDFAYRSINPFKDGITKEEVTKKKLGFLRPNRARTLKFTVQPVCYDLGLLDLQYLQSVFRWYPTSPTPAQLTGWQCMPLEFYFHMVVDKVGRRYTGGKFDRDINMEQARVWPGPLGFTTPEREPPTN